MTLQDLANMWDIDCVIDTVHLTGEISRTPLLHNKYMRLLSDQRQRKLSIENELEKLLPDKTLYYRGKLDEDSMNRRGWSPFKLYVTGADATLYLNADSEIVDLKTRKTIIEEKIRYLEEIIKQINQRTFMIKNLIEWAKFTNGSN